MTSHSGARPSVGAALLRRLAGGCTSPEELRVQLETLPFAEVRSLLEELATLLESTSVENREAVEGPTSSAVAELVVPNAPRQSSFGFDLGASNPTGPRLSQEDVQAHRKLLIYSDGAARGNPGPAGAGAVLMAPDGKIVARLGKYLGRQTNNHAEYMALILGLRAALELGATEIEMVADSELMVKQIQKIYRVKNEHLKVLYGEATELISRFQSASIRHVLREYNREADEMSNRAIDERM